MSMPTPTLDAQCLSLARYFSGEFDNRQQSLADPAWFLHLKVWNRPLTAQIFSTGYGFFIEQVNVAAGNPPYRQRILHLMTDGEQLKGQYYGLVDPQKFLGSSIHPERLNHLRREDLVHLPTCCLTFSMNSATRQFQGRLPENTLCSIAYEGKTSYISLGFDIGLQSPISNQIDDTQSIELVVYDRGVDAVTGATTWGPRMGPFRLRKSRDFAIS